MLGLPVQKLRVLFCQKVILSKYLQNICVYNKVVFEIEDFSFNYGILLGNPCPPIILSPLILLLLSVLMLEPAE